MSHSSEPSNLTSVMPVADRIDLLCDAFECDWQNGKTPRLEDFLERIEVDAQAQLFRELLRLDFDYRGRKGTAINQTEYIGRFPSHVAAIADVFVTLTQTDEPSLDSQRVDASRVDVPILEIGRQFGDYQILGELGRGGMGAVFKARHMRLKKTVALKVLPTARTRDPDAVARFQREMEAVGQLRHPHVVEAHDAGEENGTHYLVIEYVDGLDVATVIRQVVRQASAPARQPSSAGSTTPVVSSTPAGGWESCPTISSADACEIIRHAALGLQHAHERGLIHRDIKPSKLVVIDRGHRQGTRLGSGSLAGRASRR